jgi:hypothetical protein
MKVAALIPQLLLMKWAADEGWHESSILPQREGSTFLEKLLDNMLHCIVHAIVQGQMARALLH